MLALLLCLFYMMPEFCFVRFCVHLDVNVSQKIATSIDSGIHDVRDFIPCFSFVRAVWEC